MCVAMCVVFGLDPASAVAFNYTSLSQFGSSGIQGGQFDGPQGVAVDWATHDIYVADTGNHRIEKFSSDGTFIAAWGWGVSDGIAQSEVCTSDCQAGQSGDGEGQFATPIAVAVDNSGDASNGDVYVADYSDKRVDKFNSSGQYLSSFSATTSGAFNLISGVATDAEGNVWIYASGGEVYEFGDSGALLQQWSSGNDAQSAIPGIAVGAHDVVYVVPSCGCTEVFSSFGEGLGALDTTPSMATGVATNLASGSVFVDYGTFVSKYASPTTYPTISTTTIGLGTLTHGAGVGVDASNGDVYVADTASDQIDVFAPPSPGAPQVESASVADVSTNSAEVHASIYTGEYDTRYYVEYGITESYGLVVPAGGTDIGSSVEEVTANQAFSGLSPNTTYHYRVVAVSSHGTAMSSDHTFTTFPDSESFMLPDDRGYELVSPVENNGGDVGGPAGLTAQASLSGEAVAYESYTSFPGSQSAKINQYLSTRGVDGWSTQAISPSANLTLDYGTNSSYQGFSDELTSAILSWPYATLTPQAPIGYANLYVRNNSDGSYTLITTSAPANGSESLFVGASSDYSDVVFETEDALTPNAVPDTWNVYEWSNGQLSLVSVPPGGTTGLSDARAGDPGEDTQGAVSSDGQLVFWAEGGGQLYVREDDTDTVKVNSSQRTPSLGDGSATFEGATPSGELVFFSDTTALTNAPNDDGGLYEFNTSSGELTDLSPDGTGSPDLQGVVGFGENGSYVYFVADGDLQVGATAGQPNLYVEHDNELSLIATLSSEDGGDWVQQLTSRHAAVTPDGTHMVFMSVAPLTGYDNSDTNSGRPDTEVFLYDASTSQLNCVSCNPTGETPIGSSSIPTWRNSNYNSYYLSDDGDRMFFDSVDRLSLRDTNGMEDVYEWERNGTSGCAREGGCVYLISPGTGESNSTLLAAAANGSDVFFATRSQLVPQDTNRDLDVYDARVGGGFPAPVAPIQCVEEACLGAPAVAPSMLSPLTTSPQPSEPTGEAARPAKAKFQLARIGKRALTNLERTGRLRLEVTVSEPGEVWARVTTRIGARTETVAWDAVRIARSESSGLTLTLTKLARDRLAQGHKLGVTITVGYSKVAGSQRVSAMLSGSKSTRSKAKR
jgi:hypothetical protein